MDSEKQRNYWLFLGEYTPSKKPAQELWEIDPAEKTADEAIYKNGIDSYMNTSQEKLNISEGRLKKLTLLDFNSHYTSQNLQFEKYFDKEIDFDSPKILSPSLEDQVEKRMKPTPLLVIEQPPSKENPSLFTSIDAMASFGKSETLLWSDPGSLAGRK